MSMESKLVRKYNHDIGYSLVEGQMPYLMRKLYNSIIYHSQRLTAQQKGKLPIPVEWDFGEWLKIKPEQYFWMSLSELSSDSSSGNDYKNIRLLIERMMRVLVVRGDPNGSSLKTQLLGPVVFVNTKGANPEFRKGSWLVGWKFSDEALESHLLNPGHYTPISLYFQSFLKSGAALALYEIGRRSLGDAIKNRQHTASSERLHWEEWQRLLVTDGTPRKAYKEFKRDFLKPALAQINAKESTDITVEMLEITASSSRAVETLTFEFRLRAQAGLALLALDGTIPTDLMDKLALAGIPDAAADKLLGEFGEDRVRANIDYYLEHGKDKGAGWLVSAIRDDYATGAAKKTTAKAKAIATSNEKYAATVAAASTPILDQIPEAVPLSGAELADTWREFCASAAPLRKLFKGLPEHYADADTKAQRSFNAWLATRMAGTTLDDQFAILWAAYPRQTNRVKAQKAFAAMFPTGALNDDVKAILTGIECWKRSMQWSKESGKYVVGFDRFIAEEIWKETPAAAQGSERPIGEEFRVTSAQNDAGPRRSFFRKGKTV